MLHCARPLLHDEAVQKLFHGQGSHQHSSNQAGGSLPSECRSRGSLERVTREGHSRGSLERVAREGRSQVAPDRASAKELGQRLLTHGYLHHITRDCSFKDKDILYEFAEHKPQVVLCNFYNYYHGRLLLMVDCS